MIKNKIDNESAFFNGTGKYFKKAPRPDDLIGGNNTPNASFVNGMNDGKKIIYNWIHLQSLNPMSLILKMITRLIGRMMQRATKSWRMI